MSCESHSAIWMSAPLHQYQMTPVPAQCLCFQNNALPLPVQRQTADQCILTAGAVQCEKTGNHLLRYFPSLAVAGHLQFPPGAVCSCFSDSNDCHKVASIRCLCSPSQQLHATNGGPSSGTYSALSPFSGPTSQQPHLSTRCVEKQNDQRQQYDKLSLAENTASDHGCNRTHVSPQTKEDSKLSCVCSKQFTSVSSYPPKSSTDQSSSHKCTCIKYDCDQPIPNRIGQDNALVTNCQSSTMQMVFQEGSNKSSVDAGCVDVLKWQCQHLQQLAMQKSEVSH
jgi:hypothetical protein